MLYQPFFIHLFSQCLQKGKGRNVVSYGRCDNDDEDDDGLKSHKNYPTTKTKTNKS